MKGHLRLTLVRHGLINVAIGVLAGFPYSLVLTGDAPGTARAWHQVHMEGILTGLLVLGVASIVDMTFLGEKNRARMAVAFIVQAYGFTLGALWGALAGVRGLGPELPVSNLLMFAVNVLAIASVLFGMALAIFGVFRKEVGAL